MRIGLIAAFRRSADGALRAELPLAGRSVLGWQADVLQALGADSVVCLTETPTPAILQLQHTIEAGGAAFHALNGFAALPALVRAEDDLIIIADGLVPDLAVVQALVGGEGALHRVIAAIPADHPLAADHPQDFERIDAQRHWAGVLVMRGAAVQQLADFPADADAVSLLLRLALQAATPVGDLALRELLPERWLLADSPEAVASAQTAMIAAAAPPADWRAPLSALAAVLVRGSAPRGLVQGPVVATCLGLAVMLIGVMVAAFGPASVGLALAGIGAFGARVGQAFSTIAGQLRRDVTARASDALTGAVDALGSLALWFALAPWPQWQPLAVLGPLTLGLARCVAGIAASPVGKPASDRAAILLVLALAAAFGVLPEALACTALGLLAALLLRGRAT